MWVFSPDGAQRNPVSAPHYAPLHAGYELTHPLQNRQHRTLALRFAGDPRSGELRGPGIHHEVLVERIPGAGHVRGWRRTIVLHEIADQMPRHAELHIAVDVLVVGNIDLRDQRLEPIL